MECPRDYVSFSDVATLGAEPPDVTKYACVHRTFVQPVLSTTSR